jgi:epoxyqueuosine reductase QueG
MLITDQGCSGRLGSLATDMPLTPTPRSAISSCLYLYNESCKQCVKNCPQGALQDKQFDRHKCYELLLQNAEVHKEKGKGDACGKCLSYVACSYTNPVKKLLAKKQTN